MKLIGRLMPTLILVPSGLICFMVYPHDIWIGAISVSFLMKEFKFKWPSNYEIGNLKKWNLGVMLNLGLHMYYEDCKNKDLWVSWRLHAADAPKINPMNRLSNASSATAKFLWRCWSNCSFVVLWVFCSVFKGEQICWNYTRQTCGYASKTWTHIFIDSKHWRYLVVPYRPF